MKLFRLVTNRLKGIHVPGGNVGAEYPSTRKGHDFETRGPRYRAQYINEY